MSKKHQFFKALAGHLGDEVESGADDQTNLDQLQPIEVGTPFRSLIETHGASHLTEIHRQKIAWQRQASRNLSQDKMSEAISAYEGRGAVAKRSSRDTALAKLVKERRFGLSEQLRAFS